MILREVLKHVAKDLRRLDVRWALVGGMAVSARATPRFTHDLDFAVSVASDEEAERIVRALLTAGYRMPIVMDQVEVGRLSTIRTYSPYSEEYLVDFLFAASGIEQEVVTESSPIAIVRGLTVPVAALPHLIAMKVLSANERRTRDWDDIEDLIKHSNAVEISQARRLVRLITDRGYAQGRDLLVDFDMYVRRYRSKPT
jgi:hypothetical protein